MKLSSQTKKLIALFCSITIMILVLGVFAEYTLSVMDKKSKEINDIWLHGIDLTHTMKNDGANFKVDEYMHIISTNVSGMLNLESDMSRINGYMKDNIKKYKDIAILSKDVQSIEKVQNTWEAYLVVHEKFISISTQLTTKAEALSMMSGECEKAFEQFDNEVEQIIKFSQQNAATAYEDGNRIYLQMRMGLIILLAAALGLSIIVTFIVILGINNPMQELKRITQKVAGGILTEKAHVKAKNEFAELAKDINSMIDSLRDIIGKIKESSLQIASFSVQLSANAEENSSASEEIASTTQETAMGSVNQVNKINSATMVVDELSSFAQEVSHNVNTTSILSLETSTSAQEGDKQVRMAVQQMDFINEVVSSSGKLVTELGEKSNQIGQIVDAITSISGQTNLLALNAAIEAARAGEAGKGFAVVADEVRKLAEQSGEATKNITQIIKEIQDQTIEAVESMNGGTDAVKEGIIIVRSTGEVFNKILISTKNVTEQMRVVSESVNKMNENSRVVASNMRDILEIAETSSDNTQNVASTVEEQTASMEEIASSANTLSSMAEELQSLVSNFEL